MLKEKNIQRVKGGKKKKEGTILFSEWNQYAGMNTGLPISDSVKSQGSYCMKLYCRSYI